MLVSSGRRLPTPQGAPLPSLPARTPTSWLRSSGTDSDFTGIIPACRTDERGVRWVIGQEKVESYRQYIGLDFRSSRGCKGEGRAKAAGAS